MRFALGYERRLHTAPRAFTATLIPTVICGSSMSFPTLNSCSCEGIRGDELFRSIHGRISGLCQARIEHRTSATIRHFLKTYHVYMHSNYLSSLLYRLSKCLCHSMVVVFKLMGHKPTITLRAPFASRLKRTVKPLTRSVAIEVALPIMH